MVRPWLVPGLGEFRYHVLGEQSHGFLRGVDIERAEIDLQRRVLEFADAVLEAADDGFDLIRRADPGAAAFDLAFQRGILHPADRYVVAFVILRRRALRPFTGRLIKRDKIILKLPPRNFAGEFFVLIA